MGTGTYAGTSAGQTVKAFSGDSYTCGHMGRTDSQSGELGQTHRIAPRRGGTDRKRGTWERYKGESKGDKGMQLHAKQAAVGTNTLVGPWARQAGHAGSWDRHRGGFKGGTGLQAEQVAVGKNKLVDPWAGQAGHAGSWDSQRYGCHGSGTLVRNTYGSGILLHEREYW